MRIRSISKVRLYERYLSQHVRLSPETMKQNLVYGAPYMRRMIASWLPPDRSVRILDLGCGYGAIVRFSARPNTPTLPGWMFRRNR